ncbi:MAG: MFS transporter [Candidatus Thalassarchaeaceae archaeon]|nr:MFS transporter [Candidatus Thalassarchaeaceae archaeon]
MGDQKEPPSGMGILFLVVLIDLIGFTLVIPFLTYFVQDLATGDGFTEIGERDLWVGIMLAAYTFGQFLFTPILGSLSDRLGRRPIIMLGLVSNTIFFIAFGLSGSLWFALIVRFLAGAGNGNIAVARAYIGDISTPSQLKGRMGMIGAAFGLGFMIGPFLGGILTDPYTNFGGVFLSPWWQNHPYFLPCLIAGLLSAVSFSLAIRQLPESLPLESRTKVEKKGNVLKRITGNLVGIQNLSPSVRILILVNSLFLVAFTIMHTTFILFTAMPIEQGGLGFDARVNGYLFAFVGLVGVFVQGGFMRSAMAERIDTRKMMVFGLLVCGLGLGWIPYLTPEPFIVILLPMACIALGNGLFQPTQNTLMTLEARASQLDLGRVMGAQEGYGALSRIIGPILAAFVWAETVDGTGKWTYHTVFRLSCILTVIAAFAQISLRLTANQEDE